MPVRRIPIGSTSFNYDFQDEPTGIAGGVGNAISTFLKAPLARAEIEQQEDDRAQNNYDRAQRIRISQQRADDEHQYRMGLIQERQNDNARKWVGTIGTGLKGVLGPIFGMHHGSMTDAQREHLALEIAKSRKAKGEFGAQSPLDDQDLEDAHYYIDHGVFPHRAAPAASVVPAAPTPEDHAGLTGVLKAADSVDPIDAPEDPTFLGNPISAAARGVGSLIYGKGQNTSPPPAVMPPPATRTAAPAAPLSNDLVLRQPAPNAPVVGNDMEQVQIDRTLKALHPNDQAKFKAILASGDPTKIETAKRRLLTLAAQPAEAPAAGE